MQSISDKWIRKCRTRRALWIHDGNPLRPHALLSAGDHSNGFANTGILMEDPRLLDEAAGDLMKLMFEVDANRHHISMVTGPGMGAITWAHDVARRIGCVTAYTTKHKSDIDGSSWMEFDRWGPEPEDIVFPVEDVITTGKSVEDMLDAIASRGAKSIPFVGAIVNRSGLSEVRGHKIIALISHPIPKWQPADCPLCAQGSEAIPAKGEVNWARLNATY